MLGITILDPMPLPAYHSASMKFRLLPGLQGRLLQALTMRLPQPPNRAGKKELVCTRPQILRKRLSRAALCGVALAQCSGAERSLNTHWMQQMSKGKSSYV